MTSPARIAAEPATIRVDPDSVRNARLAKFWTQGELAARSRLTPQTIHRLETGKAAPRLATIRLLAEALGVQPMDLVA